MGTLPYMAPEQLEGRSDARTDFACGAVIFEMLTGRRAFDGTSSSTLMASIVSHDPVNSLTDRELPEFASVASPLLAQGSRRPLAERGGSRR